MKCHVPAQKLFRPNIVLKYLPFDAAGYRISSFFPFFVCFDRLFANSPLGDKCLFYQAAMKFGRHLMVRPRDANRLLAGSLSWVLVWRHTQNCQKTCKEPFTWVQQRTNLALIDKSEERVN